MTGGSLLTRALRRAGAGPEAPLYSFVDERGAADTLTLSQTLAAAEGVAAALRERHGVVVGEPVLLVHPPGLAFVPALIGCMIAGVVPVPVFPPDPLAADGAEALAHIAIDTGARLALTTGAYNRARLLGAVRRRWHAVRWPELAWVATDGLRARPPAPSGWARASAEATLLLQYTSGSTSAPRGVEISHANVEHQLAFNRETLGGSADAHAVMWVPQYHDFGLISGILSALYGNWRLTFLSPMTFLQRPRIWFDTIHRLRATHTAAPDFGYALAARKLPADVIGRWDLSCLRVAMTAAEPIREATIDAFCGSFAAARFNRDAFCHAYGLAEHTVGVTVGGRGFVRVSGEHLSRRRFALHDGAGAVTLARCGRPGAGVSVRIVDAATGRACGGDEVGEIWVHSPSVAAGYFRRELESRSVFHATLDGDARHWLRTGDLGVLVDGELIVCGRAKDVVIVRGRNLYPQDIEVTAQRADPGVRPGNVIAFSAEQGGQEVLVVVAEVRDPKIASAARTRMAEAITAAVRGAHGVAPAEVVLLAAGALPKTTSGKVQRRRCRSLWLDGSLAALLRWSSPRTREELSPREVLVQVLAELPGMAAEHRLARLVDAMIGVFAGLTGLPREVVAPDVPMQAQGVDSLAVAELARTLEEACGVTVPLTVLVVHASLDWLSAWLLGEVLRLPFVAAAAPTSRAPACSFGGRRREPRHTRVAVIGGGVAGLVAADTLRSLGYRHITVYEAGAEVGGKVRTVWHDGRPYELGQVGFVDSYTHTLAQLRASGLTTRVGQGRPWAACGGEQTPVDLAEAATWAERLRARERSGDADPSRPIREWLDQSGAGPLPPAYQLYWTGFGYGHEDAPAAYLLEYLRLLPRITIVVQAEQGNQKVWTELAGRLADDGVQVRRGCAIDRVTTRAREPVAIERADGAVDEVDEVVFACPPWAAARMLVDPAERAMLAKFRATDYRAALIEVEGLLDRGGSLVLLDALEGRDVGRLISCSRPYDDTDIVVVYQYASPPDSNTFDVLSEQQLDERLARDLELRGARLVRILERARWRYFPHLSPEDLAAGTLAAIEALQGHDGRWFVGSHMCLETVEAVARHSAGTISQGFGEARPRTQLDRLDDAMARDAEAPAMPFPGDGAPPTLAQRALLAARRRVPRLDTARSVVHVRGAVASDVLAVRLQRQIARIEGLRLRVWGDGDDAVVRLHASAPVLERGWSHAAADEPFSAWLARFHARPTDDPRLPGALFALCSLGPDHHAVAFTIDHLLWDAIGQTWMMRLLADACADDVPMYAPELPTRHPAILERERAYASSPVHAADREYWRARLPALLPVDEPRELTGPSDARSHAASLSPRLRAAMRSWSDVHGATTTLHVTAGLLCRWVRAGHVAGRVLVDVRATSRPGLFDGGIEPQQRSFPLGVRLTPDAAVADLLAEVRAALVEGGRHAAPGADELAELMHACGQAPPFLWDVNVFPQLLSLRAGPAWLRMDAAPATHHEHRASFRVIEDIGAGTVSIVLLHRLSELSAADGERTLQLFVGLLAGLVAANAAETVETLLRRPCDSREIERRRVCGGRQPAPS